MGNDATPGAVGAIAGVRVAVDGTGSVGLARAGVARGAVLVRAGDPVTVVLGLAPGTTVAASAGLAGLVGAVVAVKSGVVTGAATTEARGVTAGAVSQVRTAKSAAPAKKIRLMSRITLDKVRR